MATLYYDLSEQFLASGSRFKYYGISRTVMEIGYELAQSKADVRFVIFSPAHDRFFEVYPRIGSASPTGVLDPNLPHEATPIRLRYSFPKASAIRDVLYPLIRSVVRKVNLFRWRSVSKDRAKEVDLSGQVLVSLGRPKIMADYLTALGDKAKEISFYPLLHDMIPLHEFAHPSQTMFSNNFTHDNHIVIQHAKGLLSNSRFTKLEIERFSESGHLPAIPKVVAVSLAHQLRETNEAVSQENPPGPYLMSVGILTGRKNLECVMGALMLLHEAGKPVPHFCLAGARRKRAETYIDQAQFSPIRSKIHYVLNPNQSELRALYEGALALVIPSKMEGWGLPLGEALWLGVPGLASTAPALREVGGDIAQYFEPEDTATLAGYIDSLQSDPEYFAQAKAEIRAQRHMLRSWADVAADILVAVQ